MDEEALKLIYKYAQSEGYKKDIKTFQGLLKTDKEALKMSFDFAVSEGYKKDINSFGGLVGVGETKPVKQRPTTDLSAIGRTPIDSEIPIPLTTKGREAEVKSQIVKKEKALKLSEDLGQYDAAYKQAQGQKASETMKNVSSIKEEAKQKNKEGGVADSFMSGLAGFNKGLYKIPRYIYELSASPQNFIAEKLDMPELSADYDFIKESTGAYSPLTVLDNLGDKAEQTEGSYQNRIKKYNDDITSSIGKGNFADAGAQIVNNISQSIPAMLGMAMTSGVANAGKLGYIQKTLANSLPFASSQNEVLRNEEVPEYIRPISAGLNALAEVIFDQSFGTQAAIDNVVKLFKDKGVDVANDAARELTKGYLGKAMSALGGVKSIAKGSLEEMTTTFSQNLVNKVTVNPEQDLMQGVLDAGLVGGTMTGTVAIGGKALAGRYNKAQKKELETLSQQRSDIIDDLDKTNVSDEIKESLTESLDVVDAKIEGITEDSESEVDSLPIELKEAVQQKQGELEALENQIESEDVTETTKSILQEKANQLEIELNTIIDSNNPKNQTINEEANEPQNDGNDARNEEEISISQESTKEENGSQENGLQEVVPNPKPEPRDRIKVLGQDVNIYQDYLPNKEDVEGDAVYTFRADSKEKLPETLQNDATVNTLEVNGVKSETWSASITGDELTELYKSQEVSTEPSNSTDAPIVNGGNEALKNVESTTKALEQLSNYDFLDFPYTSGIDRSNRLDVSEAYHKAKSDGTNPELVKAVEDLLGKPTQQPNNTAVNEEITKLEEEVEPIALEVAPAKLTKPREVAIKKQIVDQKKALLNAVKESRKQANVGFAGVKVIKELTKLGALYLEQGTIKFSDWSKQLIKDYGEAIEQKDLVDLYKRAAKAIKVGIIDNTVKKRIEKTLGISIRDRALTKFAQSVKNKKYETEVLKQDINNEIDEARKQGLFKGDISGNTAANLIKRVNNANTPLQLLKAIDYVQKGLDNIEYDKDISKAKRSIKTIKVKANNPKTPDNIRQGLKALSRIKPENVENIKEFNEYLDTVTTSLKGTGISGLATDEMYSRANEFDVALEKYNKEKYIALLDALGVDEKSYKDMTLAEMQDLVSANQIDMKEGTNSFYEAEVDLLRNDILNDTELTEDLSKRDKDKLDALLEIDYTTFSKDNTDKIKGLSVKLKNFLANGALFDVGGIIADNEVNKTLKEKGLLEAIKKGTQSIARLFKGDTVKNFSNVYTRMAAVTKSSDFRAKLDRAFGLTDLANKVSSFVKAYTDDNKVVESILKDKRYREDLQDPTNNIILSMYTELNQYRFTDSPEQRQQRFEDRKETIRQSIELMREKVGKDTNNDDYRRENKELFKSIEKAYEAVENTKTAEEVFNLLKEGQRQLYKKMRGFFESKKEVSKSISEAYKNKVFDDDWANYFPRSYKTDGNTYKQNVNDAEKLLTSDNNTFFTQAIDRKPVAKSLNARTLEGDKLPLNKVIDFDIVNAYTRNTKEILYDEYTIKERHYAASALANRQLNEASSDVSVTEEVKNALIRIDNNSKRLLINYKDAEGLTIQKVINYIKNKSVAMSLGGASAFFKQYGATLASTTVNLGRNADYFFRAQKDFITDEFAAALVAQSQTGNRNTDKISGYKPLALKAADINLIKRTVGSQLKKAGAKAYAINSALDEVSLKGLTFGDYESARAAWLAYYADYLQRNINSIEGYSDINWSVESANPNKEAMAYAEGKVADTLNASNPVVGADQRAPFWLIPYASFAINDVLNEATAISNISRKVKKGDLNVAPEIRYLLGTIASKYVFNMVGELARKSAIVIGSKLVYSLIAGDDEIDEEDRIEALKRIKEYEEELVTQNKENSKRYLIADLIGSNIVGQYSKPIVDPFIDYITDTDDAKTKFANDPLALLGGFSAYVKSGLNLAKVAYAAFESDEKYRSRKYGYLDPKTGEVVIDSKGAGINKPKSISNINQMMLAANFVQFFGASDQTIGSIARQTKKIVKEVEAELDGKDNKFTALKKARGKEYETFEFVGETHTLTPEQTQTLRKIKADNLKTPMLNKGELVQGVITSKMVDLSNEKVAEAKVKEYFLNNLYPKLKGTGKKPSETRGDRNLRQR